MTDRSVPVVEPNRKKLRALDKQKKQLAREAARTEEYERLRERRVTGKRCCAMTKRHIILGFTGFALIFAAISMIEPEGGHKQHRLGRRKDSLLNTNFFGAPETFSKNGGGVGSGSSNTGTEAGGADRVPDGFGGTRPRPSGAADWGVFTDALVRGGRAWSLVARAAEKSWESAWSVSQRLGTDDVRSLQAELSELLAGDGARKPKR